MAFIDGLPGSSFTTLRIGGPRFPWVGGPLGLSLGRQVFGPHVLFSRSDDNPYLTMLL